MPLVNRKPSCAETVTSGIVASAAATNPAAMTRRSRHQDPDSLTPARLA
jgi:hypothetical protein